ncbi:hypothetical protein [Hyphomicrobium sp. 1Nfss2.1]
MLTRVFAVGLLPGLAGRRSRAQHTGLAPAYFVGLLWTRIGAAEDSADGL